MITRSFIIALVLSLTYSCSSKVELAIDNPTDVPVLVKIDTLSVEIPEHEVVWVEMGTGKHNITLENDSLIEFDFQNSLYMVNPTLSPYLLTTEIYGTPPMFNKSTTDTVDYLGIEMIGDYKIIDKLIHPITWEYGPREDTPEMIEIESSESFATVRKLVGPQEFKDNIVESINREMGDQESGEELTFEQIRILMQMSSNYEDENQE